jgi:hypothetical protein
MEQEPYLSLETATQVLDKGFLPPSPTPHPPLVRFSLMFYFGLELFFSLEATEHSAHHDSALPSPPYL